MLQGPGENAGVVDLGEGEAVAFKVESHNHPSAVEPFQGAATGVGGILRDIVAMGARPIALLDGLRFGEPGWQFERAVSGIGHYGNCVRGPNGRRRHGLRRRIPRQLSRQRHVRSGCCRPTASSLRARKGRGTSSSSTGRRRGATASAARACSRARSSALSRRLRRRLKATAAWPPWPAAALKKRPSVQIGDPFNGKKLIEVSAELVERDLVVSLQDCGAAGLASSLSEMAKGGQGIDVHLDRVPLPRGGHGGVGDHDLGEPGADGGRRRTGAAGRRRGGVRPLGAAVHGRRRSEPSTPASSVLFSKATSSARSPRSCSRTRRRATRCPASRGNRRRPRPDPKGPTRSRLFSTCSPHRTSAAAPGSTRVTTSSSARARSSGPASTPP